MDSHDMAHYGLAALLAGAIGYGGYQSRAELPERYRLDGVEQAVKPFAGQRVIVFAAPGSASAPRAIAGAIKAAGGEPKVEMDSLAHEGMWVSPDTPEGRDVAKSLSDMIGETVAVGNYPQGEQAYHTAYFIGVGTPKQK
jgi:hypothetical protein